MVNMLLSKTGSRIKQLVPHKRKKSIGGLDFQEHSPITTETNESVSIPRRLSWRLSQKPYFAIPEPNSTNSMVATDAIFSQSFNSPAVAPVSSLCVCGCEPLDFSNEGSLLRPEQVRRSLEFLYHPPLFICGSFNEARTRKITSHGRQVESRVLCLSKNDADSVSRQKGRRIYTLGRSESSLVGLQAGDETNPRNYPETAPQMDNFLGDVDQLIRDTDGALKAVGNALADAKAVTKSWYDITPSMALNPAKVGQKVIPPLGIQQTPTIPRGAVRRAPRVSTMHTRTAVSGPKIKRKKTVKKIKQLNALNRVARSGFPSLNQSNSKWKLLNVTMNMVDALSAKGLGKRFRAIEADEMLTPGRLQQIRREALLEVRTRNSSESSRSSDTATSNTPTEPFHLEDLSSRLDAALLQESSSALEAMHITHNIQPRKADTTFGISVANPPQESVLIKGLEFSQPSPPTHESLNLVPFDDDVNDHTNSKTLVLSAIPQISPFKFFLNQFPSDSPPISPVVSTGVTSFYNVVNKPTLLPQNDGRNLYLPTTLYTKVAPLFLQGAIRLSSKSLESQRLEQKYSSLHAMWEETEPLDWIAFQMAMLGNSLLQANEDDDDDDDYNDQTDLITWWEGFAIGPPGRLIKEEVRYHLDVESIENSGVVEAEEMFEADLDDDVEELTEHYVLHPQPLTLPSPSSQLLYRNSVRHRKPLPFDLSRPSKTAELDSTSTSVRSSAPETPASLPASPIFALLGNGAGCNVEEKEEPKIPMGFNLSHDLGDFLEWEMRHVPSEEDIMEEDIYGA
jgi:hypothetical protein